MRVQWLRREKKNKIMEEVAYRQPDISVYKEKKKDGLDGKKGKEMQRSAKGEREAGCVTSWVLPFS